MRKIIPPHLMYSTCHTHFKKKNLPLFLSLCRDHNERKNINITLSSLVVLTCGITKESGTSAVTVMYAGTAQSLNGLARDLLASEPFTKAVICELVSSLRLVAGLQTAFLSSK